jgi:hypothetical protein
MKINKSGKMYSGTHVPYAFFSTLHLCGLEFNLLQTQQLCAVKLITQQTVYSNLKNLNGTSKLPVKNGGKMYQKARFY